MTEDKKLSDSEYAEASKKVLAQLAELHGYFDFVPKCISIFAGWGPHAPSLYIRCNDLFFWACSDGEDLTADDFPRFLDEIKNFEDEEHEAFSLGWCMRERNLRCQRPYMKYLGEKDHAVFAKMGFKIEDLPHYGSTQGWASDDKEIITEKTGDYFTDKVADIAASAQRA